MKKKSSPYQLASSLEPAVGRRLCLDVMLKVLNGMFRRFKLCGSL